MVSIEVDDDKFEVLKARGKEKGFDDTEEYIDHLLSQIVEKIGREKQDLSGGKEEEVKEKLEELGYM
ncbi:MAG: hypothetical protein ABEK16_01500 [Candidatus Nanohalobium sp.]